MLEVKRVLPEELNDYWDKVAHLFANDKVLSNWITVEAIKARLDRNGADLWVTSTLDSALIGATYRRADGNKTYVVEMMASNEGAKEGWREVIRPIETQAKEWGCISIQIRGRKGWQRLFKDYKIRQVTLEHDL